MDVSLIADTLIIATQQTLGSANSFLLHRQNCINLADQSSQICVVVVDALAPPPVKSKTSRRTLLRKRRRTRRRSQTDGDSGGFGEEYGFFCGGDGLFGGGGGGDGGGFGGGGRGWNFDKFGGHDWDEPSWWFSSRSSGFAYGFVYEVIYWIALSNCVHFAFKKVVRIVADGIGDTERGKAVPMRLATVC